MEQGDGAWEDRDVSMQKVRDFLRDVLQVTDADNRHIVDAHRLATMRNRKPLPMIFKVGDAKLRRDIAKNLNKLSLYNKDRENKVCV